VVVVAELLLFPALLDAGGPYFLEGGGRQAGFICSRRTGKVMRPMRCCCCLVKNFRGWLGDSSEKPATCGASKASKASKRFRTKDFGLYVRGMMS
jgi:hypothetical protein